LIRAGEVVTRAALPEIKKWLQVAEEPITTGKTRKPSTVQTAAAIPVE